MTFHYSSIYPYVTVDFTSSNIHYSFVGGENTTEPHQPKPPAAKPKAKKQPKTEEEKIEEEKDYYDDLHKAQTEIQDLIKQAMEGLSSIQKK